MELYSAIKNILDDKGHTFLVDPRMINAIEDYQGFGKHPALKSVFRFISNEGYLHKLLNINNWTNEATKLKYNISNSTGIAVNIIDYVLTSCAYGLSYQSSAPLFKSIDSQKTYNNPNNFNWAKANRRVRSQHLKDITEVDYKSFNDIGLELSSFSFTAREDDDLCFNYEVRGALTLPHSEYRYYAAMKLMIYDNSNSITEIIDITSFFEDNSSLEIL